MSFSFVIQSCLVELCAPPVQEAALKDQETQISGDPPFPLMDFDQCLGTETLAETSQPGGPLGGNCVRRERKGRVLKPVSVEQA